MTTAAALRCLLVLAAALLAGSAYVAREARADDKLAAAGVTAASPFTFVDVFIDPQGKPLAAYQFELRTAAGEAKLVGIEGGDHAAFAHPPYYDPKALMTDRVVIAAFNTAAADKLPSGKTRGARLMVRAGGGNEPARYDVKLQVAASADAKPIQGLISVVEGVAP